MTETNQNEMFFSPSDLAILERAGILAVVARCGSRVEYRVARGWECLVAPTAADPSADNRPAWAYERESLNNEH